MSAEPEAGDANAPRQHWDPERYARNARFVADLGQPVVDLLAPQAGERILDLGGGDGALSEVIRAAGAEVLCVDASAEQIAAARMRGLEAEVVDGEALAYEAAFDAVFSNAALHWMTRPERVIAGVQRALKPGGRFVGEFGGAGNVALICAALEAALDRRGGDGKAANPWFFPTPEEYGALLEAGGFRVRAAELIPRPTPLPGAMVDWLQTFAESFIKRLPEAEQGPYLEEVSAALAPDLRDAESRWTADYVRLRFAAHRVD